MSMEYWVIQGVGLCAEDVQLSETKLRAFLLEQFRDDTDTIEEINSMDTIDLNRFLYGEPYSNLGELLTVCDDTGTMTYDDNGDCYSYFLFAPRMPWEFKNGTPMTIDQCHDIIVRAVQRVSDMSREQILALIDDYLHVVGCG